MGSSTKVSLEIVIIGAGIAGLSAALALLRKNPNHKITILERSNGVEPPGSSVAVVSNCTRVLDYLGVFEELADRCRTIPHNRFFRRWEDGEVLMDQLPKDMGKVFGYPFEHLNSIMVWVLTLNRTYCILRADLHQILLDAAISHGANIQYSAKVKSVSVEQLTVFLDGQEPIKCDLIIGADGVNSTIRSQICPELRKTRTTYDIRFVAIPESWLLSDPITAPLLGSKSFWFGPEKAIVAGSVSAGDENLYCMDWATVIPESDNVPLGIAIEETDPQFVLDRYSGWDPSVLRTLEIVKSNGGKMNRWRLTTHDLPARWFTNNGHVVLIGDALHANLPVSGQGGAMAIEDSVCLAECIDRMDHGSESDIVTLLEAWEKIRRPRIAYWYRQVAALVKELHLPDGPGQDRRDKKWKAESGGAEFLGIWDGKHIDLPPEDPLDNLRQVYMSGYKLVDHTNRMLDQWLGGAQNHH